jgi:hypothetical protein
MTNQNTWKSQTKKETFVVASIFGVFDNDQAYLGAFQLSS